MCEQTVDTSTKAKCALTAHFHVPVWTHEQVQICCSITEVRHSNSDCKCMLNAKEHLYFLPVACYRFKQSSCVCSAVCNYTGCLGYLGYLNV